MSFGPLFAARAPRDAALILGRQVCGEFESASRHEWLVTNGLGGYACGTVAGANTRRYHAFLMASLAPPGARTLLVAKVDVAARYEGIERDLGSNEFAGGAVSPRGFVHLESFRVLDGVPTWLFALGDALLRQQIFMAPGQNSSYLRFDAFRTRGPIRLTLRPLVTWRDYHAHGHGGPEFGLEPVSGGCRVLPPGGSPYWLQLSQGQFTPAPEWYWHFWHRMEAERGLDADEDLLMPGSFQAELTEGQPLHFVASLQPDASDPDSVRNALLAQNKSLRAALPREAPPWIHSLALASQQFIVRREPRAPATGSMTSIIAGYPWFADWGRDTMISLPGLALELGRYEVAAGILRTYLGHVDGGMLPNRFSDDGDRAEYNTADATLWMFVALDEYLKAQRDPGLAADAFPVLMSILRAHHEGTRFDIHVDPRDGLLHAGEHGSQLTWMDARHGDTSFTPRIGKPVEINALWVNALDVTARLAARLRASHERKFCLEALDRAVASFPRFWNAGRGCLYDVIDTDGGTGLDARIRPNQVLALSLPLCPLPPEQLAAVLTVSARELLTSHGLRSLAPGEEGYQGQYTGDAWRRDSAYHMGTVWSWLLGPFARAHFRVHRNPRLALSFLEPMQRHVGEACMGSVSEIFDGDAPHAARGCFAQAWSVAEILRTWLFLSRGGLAREVSTAVPNPAGAAHRPT